MGLRFRDAGDGAMSKQGFSVSSERARTWLLGADGYNCANARLVRDTALS